MDFQNIIVWIESAGKVIVMRRGDAFHPLAPMTKLWNSILVLNMVCFIGLLTAVYRLHPFLIRVQFTIDRLGLLFNLCTCECFKT